MTSLGFASWACVPFLAASALGLSACSKDTPPAGEGSATSSTSARQTEPAAAQAEPSGTSGETSSAASAAALAAPGPDCRNPDHWETQAVPSLKDGAVQLPKAGLTAAPLGWEPCEGTENCVRPVLPAGGSVLGIGALGNRMKLAVKDPCDGGAETISVHSASGEVDLVLRGQDFVFENAVLGGDRVLLGGFAKHASKNAKEGHAKREYLLTRREFGEKKFEAARNEQLFVPHTASSQLIHVRGETQCTGAFWKIGVEQCDFAGPGTEVFALFGGHLIYADPATSKGMAWDAKQGPRVLLDQLDWVMTEGVNVAWSSNGNLFTAQPRWDLPELVGKAGPGDAGPKPLAFGCGRTLRAGGAAWELRDVQRGQSWTLEASRFPEGAENYTAVMNCEYVLFSSGERVSLKALGLAHPVAASSAAADGSAAPGSGGDAPPAGSAEAPAAEPNSDLPMMPPPRGAASNAPAPATSNP